MAGDPKMGEFKIKLGGGHSLIRNYDMNLIVSKRNLFRDRGRIMGSDF